MAEVRQRVVCRLHDEHDRQLGEGRYTYVVITISTPGKNNEGKGLTTHGAGFVAFDQYKKLLADHEGKISGPRTVIAGFGAGVTESLLAVTPTESIKTTL